jgi:hypothetical protein
MESEFGGVVFLPLLDFFLEGLPSIFLLFCILVTKKNLEVLMKLQVK